jgi:hypothetical protein
MDGYLSGWRAYDRTLRRPPASLPARARAMYWLSANVIKAHEDKKYPCLGSGPAAAGRNSGVARQRLGPGGAAAGPQQMLQLPWHR